MVVATEVAQATTTDHRLPAGVLLLAAVSGALVVGVAASIGALEGVAALLLVVTGLALLRRPDLAGLVLVAMVPAMSGVRRGFPAPGLRLSELLIVGVGGLVVTFAARRTSRRWEAVEWLAMGYAATTIAIGSLALATRGIPFTAKTVGTMLTPFGLLLLYRAVTVALQGPAKRRDGIRVFLWASLPVSLLSLLQYLDIGPVRRLLEELVASENFAVNTTLGFQSRVTGPFVLWHSLAGYLLPVLLLCTALLLEGSGRVMNRLELLVVALPAVAAFVATYTFAAYFGLLAGALLLAVWMKKLRQAVVWLCLGALVAGLLFAPSISARVQDQYATATFEGRNRYVPQTLQYRFDVWTEQYLPALEGRLVTGYGPIDPPDVQWKHTESLYLSLLLRGGLPLLLIYLGLLWALLGRSRRLFRSDDPTQAVPSKVLAAMLLVLVPMHAVYPYFLDVGLPQALWVVAGLAFSGTGLHSAPVTAFNVEPSSERPDSRGTPTPWPSDWAERPFSRDGTLAGNAAESALRSSSKRERPSSWLD